VVTQHLRNIHDTAAHACAPGALAHPQVCLQKGGLVLRDEPTFMHIPAGGVSGIAQSYAASVCRDLGLGADWHNLLVAHVSTLLRAKEVSWNSAVVGVTDKEVVRSAPQILCNNSCDTSADQPCLCPFLCGCRRVCLLISPALQEQPTLPW
jgi:hypothetical protein